MFRSMLYISIFFNLFLRCLFALSLLCFLLGTFSLASPIASLCILLSHSSSSPLSSFFLLYGTLTVYHRQVYGRLGLVRKIDFISFRRSSPLFRAYRAALGTGWEISSPPGKIGPLFFAALEAKFHMNVRNGRFATQLVESESFTGSFC